MKKPSTEATEKAFKLAALIEGVCHPSSMISPRFPDPEDSDEEGDDFQDYSEDDLLRFFKEVKALSADLPKVILAYDTLLNNCADPDNDILDFKPEIKAAMECKERIPILKHHLPTDPEKILGYAQFTPSWSATLIGYFKAGCRLELGGVIRDGKTPKFVSLTLSPPKDS